MQAVSSFTSIGSPAFSCLPQKMAAPRLRAAKPAPVGQDVPDWEYRLVAFVSAVFLAGSTGLVLTALARLG